MRWGKRLLVFLTSLLIIALHMIPIYITVVASFKDIRDFSSKWVLPQKLVLDNFRMAIHDGGFYTALVNTGLITALSILIAVIVGSMTGYVLARLDNAVTRVVLLATLGVMMVPSISLVVPLYRTLLLINGINTYWAVILLCATYQLPLGIFIYTNFIRTVPVALDEAAEIDGCSQFGTYLRVILPQLGPVTASVMILSGVKIYNEYVFALYFLQSADRRMITTYVSSFFHEVSYINQASAAALLGALPIIVVYLVLQKWFIAGAMDSAVK